MFHSFLDGLKSTRRAYAWRTFCRYFRYVSDSLRVRQGADGAELTITEQGHVSRIDTMQGLNEIFTLLSTTILLNVIDSRQYDNPPIALSQREEEEIALAQSEAQILVHFLTDKLHLVDEETGNNVSLETAFVSYLVLQGRWLLWQFQTTSHIQQDEVCRKLFTAHFLQNNDDARQIFQKEEVWEEWGGEVPNCFQPVNKRYRFGLPMDPIKRKLVGNPTEQPLKRQRM